jgi:hypothetical protein
MFTKIDVTGVISTEALASSFSVALTARVIAAYRTFLEDSIENKYELSCNIATAEHGPVRFNISPSVKPRVSERELLDFELQCRLDYLDLKALDKV